MHQITVQELSAHIPRRIANWSSEDVCTWLTLNQIQFDASKIRSNNVNGANIRRMTPTDWMERYSLTKFIAKQIVQWLDEDAEEFDSLAAQNQPQSANINTNQVLNPKVQLKQPQTQASKISQNLHSRGILKLSQSPSQQKYHKQKSQKLLPANIKLSQQFPVAKSESSQSDNRSCDRSSSSLSGFGSSSAEDEEQEKNQIANIKKQQRIDEPEEIQMFKNNSQITERMEKKLSNPVEQKKQSPDIPNKNSLQFQSIENESLSWAKKKKDNLKAFPDKIKNKNREFSKNPKLYSYINGNYGEPNQNIVVSKVALRKVTSAQQIQDAKKISLIQAANDKKPKNEGQVPIPHYNRIQSPYVKFVSSQFVPYTSDSTPKSIKQLEKTLKIITAPGQEKIVRGSMKIGRSTFNDIVLADQTVSRNHAEIVPSSKINKETCYFLRDVGSKFGTFVECRGVQEGIQGKSYLIGEAAIQILSIQISKAQNSLNKKLTFDLRVKIDSQKQISLVNRSIVTIGRRLNSDIKIDNICGSARIWIDKDRKTMLEGLEGKLFVKLKQSDQWDIEAHLDHNRRAEIVFGCFKVAFQALQTCVLCTKKAAECICLFQEEPSKKKRQC